MQAATHATRQFWMRMVARSVAVLARDLEVAVYRRMDVRIDARGRMLVAFMMGVPMRQRLPGCPEGHHEASDYRKKPLPLRTEHVTKLSQPVDHCQSSGHQRLAILSRAARIAVASFTASSFAQKCMKNRRGSSVSMWL
jgi:hypothetical protein